jgi:tRNA G37 N-methylase Trm5
LIRIKKITELAHFYLKEFIAAGDQVIDATAGNGYDTLFLADLVGNHGHVYAFDIQPAALIITKEKLLRNKLIDRVTLIEAGHEKLDQYLCGPVAAIIYNLGYLPGGNRQKATQYLTTIESIEKALSLLKAGGVIAVVVYPGHRTGLEEKVMLLRFCSKLSVNNYTVLHLQLCNQPNNPPELLLIQKISFQSAPGV